MSRDWWMYLEDILECCEKIQRFTVGMTQADFQQDDRTYDAVVRNLEIIGEATKHIPDDVRQMMPDIEWRKVAGLRDMLAHVYFGIDDNILWDVVENKTPELQRAVAAFLSSREERDEDQV